MDRKKPGPRPHGRHAEDDGHAEETLHGVVLAYNYGPKGGVEGMLLREASRIDQVNLAPDVGLALALAVGVGQPVEATVGPEPEAGKHGAGDHRVFRLVALRASDGHLFTLAGPGHEEVVEVDGVVDRLNYAKHGEANGVVLDGGDFLHLKPEGMDRLGLEVGQRITATGRARPMLLGRRAIEAEVVNGVALGPKGPPHGR